VSSLNVINEIDAMYDKGVTSHQNGLHVCGVCGKVYKTLKAAQKHMERKDCYKLFDLVKDTMHETKAYTLYKTLVSALNPNARVTLNIFRKSPMYNPVVRFSMYCSLNEVFSTDIYVSWLNEIKGIEQVNAILSEGIKDDTLREFRLFAHKHELMPSELYYQRYKDLLMEDDDFLVRSIEKAKIGAIFIAKEATFPFVERMEALPMDYQLRLQQLYEAIR